jgi:hypothetical protein
MRQHLLTVLSVVCTLAGLSLILELVAQRQLAADPLPRATTRGTAPVEQVDPCPGGGKGPSASTIKCRQGNYKVCDGQEFANCYDYSAPSEFPDPAPSNYPIEFSDNQDIPEKCDAPEFNRKCVEQRVDCYRTVYCYWNTLDKSNPYCDVDPFFKGIWESANMKVKKKCDPNKD